MAVDKQILEECIAQAADGDKEMADFLRTRYTANDSAATKFVGGFMTQRDYTAKTQALAAERKTFESQGTQVEQLRKALNDAETEKAKIMKEVATRRISTAKAGELMKLLQEKYQLTDEDLPGMSDLIETRQTGKVVDSAPDLDDRFKEFETRLMSSFETKFGTNVTRELSAMASLPMVINEIGREHEELTGKRLTFAEQQDLLKVARESNTSLRDAWESKYQIGGDTGLRMQKRDEGMKSKWQADFEKQQADARSKAALEVVTGGGKQADLGDGPGISSAFKTKFRMFEMDPNKPASGTGDGVPTLKIEPGQHVRQSGDRGPRASERAAVKHMTTMQNGGYGRKSA